MKKSIVFVALLIPYSAVAIDPFIPVVISLGGVCGAWIGLEALTRNGYCPACARYEEACGERVRECLGECCDKSCKCCEHNYPPVRQGEAARLVESQPISQLTQAASARPVIRPIPVRARQLGGTTGSGVFGEPELEVITEG